MCPVIDAYSGAWRGSFGYNKSGQELTDYLARGDLVLPTAITKSGLNVVKSVCPLDCPDTCIMVVTVNDGVAVGISARWRGRYTPLGAHVPFRSQKPCP
jgi:hypothetical protein